MFRWLTSFLLAVALFSSAAMAGAPQPWAGGEPGGAALATDIERHSGGSDDGGVPSDGPNIALEAGQSPLDGPGLVQTHNRPLLATLLAYPVPPAAPARLLSPYLDGPQRPPRAGA